MNKYLHTVASVGFLFTFKYDYFMYPINIVVGLQLHVSYKSKQYTDE